MSNSVRKKIITVISATAVCLFGFLSYSFQTKDVQSNNKPNILLIVSEDHSPHLSAYGDSVIQTPNIDQIAKDGFLFKNAYITQSVCSPSRSSMLTGLFPHQNGHLGLTTHGFHHVGRVDNIYAMMKRAGYRTGMIGKLHVKPDNEFPIDYHPLTSPNYEKTDMQRYAEYVDNFINASNEPFFLMVNYPDAHWPFQNQVEGRPRKMVTAGQVKPFPYIGFDNKLIREYTTAIYNCLLRLDECVGELMAKLKSSGKADNTLVIYLSDHGDEMARGKFDIYEVGTKVPFIVSWPARIGKGMKSDALVSSVDIVPTVLDAAGIENPGNLAGQSLLPLFRNPDMNYREYLFTEKNADQKGMYHPRRAVRDQRYKLIYTLLEGRENEVARAYMREQNRGAAVAGSPKMSELSGSPDWLKEVYRLWLNPPKFLLYDLEKDPLEFYNLAEDPKYTAVKERLFKALQDWQVKTDDPFRFPDKLQKLTHEMDTLRVAKNMVLQYPSYLYTKKLDWDSTYRPAIYDARAGQFKSFKTSSKDIIFLGNSITAYGNWSELFDNTNIKNRGIPGEITFGTLGRLNDIIRGKPSKIFILIGINDIGRNVPNEVILKNYERMIRQIRTGSPKTKIYFQTILPVNSTVLPALPHFHKEAHILAVNEGLKQLAAREQVRLIDIYPLFLDSENRLDKAYCFDGLHLNSKGYLKWAEFIKANKYLSE